MNGDDNVRLIFAVTAMVMVLSSLLAYRLPIAKLAKMILAWVGIFALAFLVMSFRPEMKMIWNRVSGEISGAPRQRITANAITLTRQDDGHFWVRATINDQDVDFMVDSGATKTAINADTADELGLAWRKAGQQTELDTANGTITAKYLNLDRIEVGSFAIENLGVNVAENFGDTNVVGMNFLDEFSRWNVEGDMMTLEPKP